MKKKTSFGFKKFLLPLFFAISVFVYTDSKSQTSVKPRISSIQYGKFIGDLEVIRVTSAADITGIPETEADVLLVVDLSSTVASATCPFPANPRDRQVFGISTRVQITSLTLDDGPNNIPITGYTAPFQLNANAVFWRIYNLSSNRWFPY